MKNYFFTIVIAAVGVIMLGLLLAAISTNRKGECKGYRITIKSKRDICFMDQKDVFKLLSGVVNGNVKGQQLSTLNINRLESVLERNEWIADAQLYFDNSNILHIVVEEREPLARLFTTTGRSFYIDSNMKQMHLSDKTSVRIPVFTGFSDKETFVKKESVLLRDVKKVAQFIESNSFWSSQVSAINIVDKNHFELFPVIGNHVVRIGDAQDLDKKFHRLFLFYQSILSKIGFDEYKIIDAQFDGQIVAIKQEEKLNTVDKKEMKRRVSELIKLSLEMQSDTLVTAKNIDTKAVFENTDNRPILSSGTGNAQEKESTSLKWIEKLNSVKNSTTTQSKGALKKQPKAAMPKKNE